MKTCPTCGIAIIDHPANECLDELVAIRIFGYIRIPHPGVPKFQKPTDNGVEALYYTPRYSSEINEAWEVVEKLAKEPKAWVIETVNIDTGLIYMVTYWGDSVETDQEAVTSSTAPLAICRASLLAVEEK